MNCDYLPPVIHEPNIFSPNDNGKNDVLFVRPESIRSFEFFVYNRWGQKVFETTELRLGWDGTINGNPADEAVFVWHLKAEFVTGVEVKRKGNVTLTR